MRSNAQSQRFTAESPFMIGLSFSLEADGSPGYYNQKIAALMEADYAALIAKHPDNAPRVGVQWEIMDALDSHDLSAKIEFSRVAAPPYLSQSDIRDPHDKALQRLLTWRKSESFEPAEIVLALNQILDDSKFAANFLDLRLPVLQRLGHRWIWVEEREVPKEFPLKPLQQRRANRLIVERLCPNAVAVGQYLNASKVFTMLFEEVRSKDEVADEIWIYAHPAHFQACRDDAQRAADGLKMRVGNFKDCTTDRWNGHLWHAQTAQNWCRSADLWQWYQKDMRLYYLAKEP